MGEGRPDEPGAKFLTYCGPERERDPGIPNDWSAHLEARLRDFTFSPTSHTSL